MADVTSPAIEGTEEDERRPFREAATALRRRIQLFLSLPLEKLDKMAIQAKVREIGTA